MVRYATRTGFWLLAIAVMGAVMAQWASAATEHDFHTDGERTVLTGKDIEGGVAFTIGTAGTIKCTTGQYEATQIGVETGPGSETYKADTLTVTPHYSGCKFGGQAVAVNFNHCAYVFDSDTGETNPSPLTKTEHANVDIECSGGSEIEIDTPACTITIVPQTIKHAVRYENDPESASAIIVRWTASKVVTGAKKTTESQAGCAAFPTGTIGTITSRATYGCSRDDDFTTRFETSRTTPTNETIEGPTTKCGVSGLTENDPGTVFTGKNEAVEKITIGKVGTLECSTAKFEGTVSEEEEAEELSALTLKPTYGNEAEAPSECSFGGKEATVKTNDCAYVLGQSTNGEGHADLEIECAEGHQIEIDTSVCTITIGPQTIKGAVHYEEDIASSFVVKITATSIVTGKVKTTESQKACLLIPIGAIGSYNGSQTVECLEDTSVFPQGDPTTPLGTGEGEAVECVFVGE